MSIEDHDWFDMCVEVKSANETAVCINTEDMPWAGIGRCDAIALAKHFNLTAYEIGCSEHKALQDDLNKIDEYHNDEIEKLKAAHFAEIEKLKATVINSNKRVN